MTFRQRIAFLDVDGTILEGGDRIAPSTVDAIRTARENGHLVYLATGRSTSEIPALVRDLGFDGAVSAGGGFAEVGDQRILERTMPAEAVERMVAYYESAGYDFYVQTFDEVFASPGVAARFAQYLAEDRVRQGAASAPEPAAATASADEGDGVEDDANASFIEGLAEVRPYPREGVAKSVFLGNDQTAYDRVAADLGGEFHVITGTIPHMGRGSGEVTLPGVDKGAALLAVVEHLGMDVRDAIAIGDGGNDIEMLQVAGVGIAMGNAHDDIKAHADEVTTAVLDDGVWNAFRRHGMV